MSAGWKIVDKSKLKISQSCSRCLVSIKNHLAAIIGRDLSDNHDSLMKTVKMKTWSPSWVRISEEVCLGLRRNVAIARKQSGSRRPGSSAVAPPGG